MGGVLAVAVAIAVVVALRFRDSETPITVAQAVEGFRAEQAPSASPLPPAEPPGLDTLPDPGVYVYVTTGSEEINALGGTIHDYPAETTLTVRTAGCGVVLRWQPLAERFEELELCNRDGSLIIPRYTSFHRFFGTDDRLDYVCEPAILLGTSADGSRGEPATCTAGDLTEIVITSVLTAQTTTVGTEEVTAVGVALAVELDGASTGDSRGEIWISNRDRVLVSWSEMVESSSSSPIGDIKYSETFEIRLTSLEPRE